MRKLNRLTMTLALLIMAVSGAWAQSTLNVVELEMPAEWETDNNPVTAADLPGFKASTLEEAKTWTGAPSTGSAGLIYAFDGDAAYYLAFNNGAAGDVATNVLPKKAVFSSKSDLKTYYTAEPTEWSLTPDETGKKWTLDKMPASDVELQVEYYAESNLFLSKEALADAANIAVKAGDLGVQFGDDGKSANTVTEGSAMTVTYNGTKKLLGMKVAKKATTSSQLSAVTTDDIGKVVCAAGHLHDAKTAVPDGCTAVGILGKVTETGHGLIIALKDATSQNWNTINGWKSASYAGTTLKVLPDDDARGINLTSYSTLGGTTVSNWAVAQKDDYVAIFVNLGSTVGDTDGKTYDDNVNAYITTGVGGTAMNGDYWSATERADGYAWNFYGEFWNYRLMTYNYIVRPVLGF